MQVARGVNAAHAEGLRFTPSFLLEATSRKGNQSVLNLKEAASLREEVESSFRIAVESLKEEAFGDVPTLGFGPTTRG
jgi:hypothetical protein